MGAAVLIGNLFVLIRRDALRRLALYAETHLDRATSAPDSNAREPHFRAVPSFVGVAWPQECRKITWRAVVVVASGISGNAIRDQANLIEIAAGFVSVVVALGAFVAGTYLLVEQPLLSTPALLAAVALGGGAAIGIVTTAIILAIGIAAARSRIAASTG